MRLVLWIGLCRLVLAADSYFPLQVGNRWVYRVNDRQSTSRYVVWRVARVESIEGTPWFVVEAGAGEVRYRSDADGRVFRLNSLGIEELWLDPTVPPSPSALLAVESRGTTVSSPLGDFADTLSYRRMQSLALERGVFVGGVGLLTSQTTMLSGSSGGFLQSLDLVEVRVGSGTLLTTGSDGLELSVERADLDVTGRQVTNCAVPCYFVACGFVTSTDPPNTYKPCFQARLRLRDFSSAGAEASSRNVDLELVNSSGDLVFRSTQRLPLRGSAVESTVFQQIPLYTVPNEAVPPGKYQVRARDRSEEGVETRSAVVSIQVR